MEKERMSWFTSTPTSFHKPISTIYNQPVETWIHILLVTLLSPLPLDPNLNGIKYWSFLHRAVKQKVHLLPTNIFPYTESNLEPEKIFISTLQNLSQASRVKFFLKKKKSSKRRGEKTVASWPFVASNLKFKALSFRFKTWAIIGEKDKRNKQRQPKMWSICECKESKYALLGKFFMWELFILIATQGTSPIR